MTRIYSVTMFYHFAFMAVSVAMFGLTVGAVIAFAKGKALSDSLEVNLGKLALLSGVLMGAAFIVELSLPLGFHGNFLPMRDLVALYFLSSLPLIPAGTFVCLALTRFPGTGYFYAWDLSGAAVGCVLFPLLVSWFGAPGAAVLTGAAACLASFIIFFRTQRGLSWLSLSVTFFFALFVFVNQHTQWLRIRWDHDGYVLRPFYERWNAFSRISVYPFWGRPYSWGIDSEIEKRFAPMEQLWVYIDSGAGTPIHPFHGNLKSLDFLHYDITDFANRLRRGKVCVIGVGGGRDILAALAYHQPSITGVEINSNIWRAVNRDFGEFAGHLDKRSDVRFVVEDGRSYLTRTRERFDIIQASLVDTGAATAAGAYAFVENGLYTVEGWKIFLQRLNPRGVLTFSRWYYGLADWPAETYRMFALSSAALKATGISEPSSHILLIRTTKHIDQGKGLEGKGLATIMISPQPFSSEDVARANEACAEMRCEVAFSPRNSLDPRFSWMLQLSSGEQKYALPLDVSPPTDDRPYFFFLSRWRDFFREALTSPSDSSAPNVLAVHVLTETTLLALAVCLALALIQPLSFGRKRGRVGGGMVFPFYFISIGLAFMFVELSLMQWLNLFLGHPTYGFTVVLFALLFSSSLGSLASQRFLSGNSPWKRMMLMGLLVGALGILRWEIKNFLPEASSWEIISRITLAIALITPAGFLMGIPFPLGMELAKNLKDGREIWFWTLNGGFSVLGSVLAMVISLNQGIAITFWAGVGLYALTTLLFAWLAFRQLDFRLANRERLSAP